MNAWTDIPAGALPIDEALRARGHLVERERGGVPAGEFRAERVGREVETRSCLDPETERRRGRRATQEQAPGKQAESELATARESRVRREGQVEQATKERIASIPAKRLGTPDEFGAACAFLCSAHAGFITGQNLLLDGGTFPGAF